MKKLKIKKNIDLKELKKFGFVQLYSNGPAYIKNLSGTEGSTGFILIKKEHKINGLPIGNAREIDCIHIDSTLNGLEFEELLSTIYDLTEAGFLEKVGN